MEAIELASKIVKILTEKRKTIASAESCTGGLISSTITDVPGASKVFLGGIVTYSSESKRKLLIDDDVFLHGVISREMAIAMAHSVRNVFFSDYGVSTTGNLGPQPMEEKPVGLIYIGMSSQEGVICRELNLSGNRVENKKLATVEALKLILEVIA